MRSSWLRSGSLTPDRIAGVETGAAGIPLDPCGSLSASRAEFASGIEIARV